MTDRQALGLVLCFLLGAFIAFLWSEGFRFGALAIGLIAGSHIYDWMDEASADEAKRPALTVFGEIAGIVSALIALGQLIKS
ncbi:hypothetical protein OOK39_44720 [Streptomyces sp. NBC_00264]|uniref:hypothetical protein n=1 Tax=unclassified Streptomyces TaxID=2593676 RepID=UPI0022579E49|nr:MULTISPECIES: hypothetical protein [unclassified Streptomyces]MCX5166148.1 hypothetical protein [Streptomyces sp. NBC_00305]MCX5224665.1 hypothetical protein [Streptomyces sp. NBC_00264]